MKNLAIFFLFFIIISCNEKGKSKFQESPVDTLPKITSEQQIALNAFNSIQTQGRNLYSVFPGSDQKCALPDTSFIISRARLLIAMNKLLERHYSNISIEERNKLTKEAVMAQEEYLVLECHSQSSVLGDSISFVPVNGLWVLPGILARRDVIIKW